MCQDSSYIHVGYRRLANRGRYGWVKSHMYHVPKKYSADFVKKKLSDTPEALDDGSERLAWSSRWSRLAPGLQVCASSLALRPSALYERITAARVPHQPIPASEREPEAHPCPIGLLTAHLCATVVDVRARPPSSPPHHLTEMMV